MRIDGGDAIGDDDELFKCEWRLSWPEGEGIDNTAVAVDLEQQQTVVGCCSRGVEEELNFAVPTAETLEKVSTIFSWMNIFQRYVKGDFDSDPMMMAGRTKMAMMSCAAFGVDGRRAMMMAGRMKMSCAAF